MKALTLTQPWATAVALGSKCIETRSWRTSYVGPIAIHAAKGYSVYDLLHKASCWNWIGALWQTGVRFGNGPKFEAVLPFGAVVAVAFLADCRPTDSFTQAELDRRRAPTDSTHSIANLYTWTERQMGDFSLGRYGFVLRDVVALETPVPVKGFQRIWNLPAGAVAAIDEQLAGVAV